MSLRYNIGLLVLRVSVSAIMIIVHGLPKLLNPSPFIQHIAKEGIAMPLVSGYLAISAETVFPLLIIAGLFTRISAFIAAVNMFIAAFVLHIMINGDPFAKWEKALLYMIIFAALAITGPGEWNVKKLFSGTVADAGS